ncbi:AI-2E family transporter [Vibrio antiquarius]|uniref:AI-2E family transporter n=1 Tax=Vibrio parahaemolyticus TaxID=670 RepID=A0AA46US56_VIBPH|nr:MULTISPECIES: AI-2E family transporter [Vibrio harveyi group]KOE93070.1 hypothetical protein ACS91_01170 [Vibrio parahaemolyticus]MCS0311661.1 AI-2E family transporter [Vibrio diabolicus]UYV30121.1 AI-2E family transporter [Vibrio parahaemolyticus]UYW18836.1 AI-2E family transporter [Vibrio parahaemolyticus]
MNENVTPIEEQQHPVHQPLQPVESETPEKKPPTKKSTSVIKDYSNPLLIMASVIIIIAGLKEAQDILAPLLLAVFLAVLCNPIVDKMESYKIPRTLASLVTVVLLGYSVYMIGDVVASSSKSFIKDMNSSVMVLIEKINEFSGDNESLIKSKLSSINPGSFINSGFAVLNTIKSSISFTFVVAFTTFLALCEGKSWQKKITAFFGTSKLSDGTSKQIQTYIYVKFLASFATGFIIATALYFIGHKYWLLWGIIATTLNFIPNIGSILAAIPALIVSMATMGLVPTLGTLAVYVSVNVVIGSYLEPKIIGDKLGLSTLIVFLSMIAFGKIFGMVGMFLSVPIIVAIKIALDVIKPDNKISLLLK